MILREGQLQPANGMTLVFVPFLTHRRSKSAPPSAWRGGLGDSHPRVEQHEPHSRPASRFAFAVAVGKRCWKQKGKAAGTAELDAARGGGICSLVVVVVVTGGGEEKSVTERKGPFCTFSAWLFHVALAGTLSPMSTVLSCS